MKLYDRMKAPSPRRVRIFLAEKGANISRVEVDVGARKHNQPDVTRVNPLQPTPALLLDDGTALTESAAICRYIEELHPTPPLFGETALQRAQVDMWQRRLEFGPVMPVARSFRHSHPAMVELEVPRIAELAVALRHKVMEFLSFPDSELASRPNAAGDRLTIAEITGLVAIDFMGPARILLPQGLTHVRPWHAAMASRPSAAA